ncbi:substrate-binding and GGDEF domain-containing protein [Deinococcus roseus]|uniref:GGDEF domain-containing protein n=1 Tax=Deinococcus roseus TaxID=392414 RepID=A0ABQ2DAL7_9DEIO|nr:GGDEF domain-containing protein [Deinococcus roseus]GGJ51876.1 hypothetical protein GCM10008938_42380 [Deinococcus roseus]
MTFLHERVAVLADHLYSYQISVLKGILTRFSAMGTSAQVYLGREISPHLHANQLYDLIDQEQHQGRVLLLHALSSHLGQQDWQDFLARKPLPTVSVTTRIADVPTVTVNNPVGIHNMMDHLIETRGYQRFVFLRGWPTNQEAIEREQAFRESLERHHLDPANALFVDGDFSAVKALLEMRKLLHLRQDFECVVCANDEMALSAVLALREHHLRVPGDVAVVGFDDTPSAVLAVPPLTTVRQPWFEQGMQAAELLHALIQGESVPAELDLPTELRVRQSCGTPAQMPQEENPLYKQLEILFLAAAADAEQLGAFLKIWEGVLPIQLQDQLKLQAWRNWLEGVYRRVQSGACPLPHLEQVYGQAQRMLLDALSIALSSASLQHTLGARHAAHLNVVAQPSMIELMLNVRTYLEELGIQGGRIVLYERSGPEIPLLGRLVLMQEQDLEDQGLFPVKQLLPDFLQHELDHGHRLVFPLVVGDQHYGLFICRIHEDTLQDETPLQSIAHAVHLVARVEEQKRSVQELELQVEARTRQLRQEISERLGAEEQLKAAHAALQVSSQLDGLTGLFNRAVLDDLLQRVLMEHQITHQPVSLLMLDVDHFKQYNDCYGHRQGDVCLKQVAQGLRSTVRDSRDIVARYGGEEFAVVLPGTGQDGAERAAKRILQAIEQLGLPHEKSLVASHVTVSIGIHTLQDSPLGVDEWVEGADQALYRAKHSGRNGYQVFKAEG